MNAYIELQASDAAIPSFAELMWSRHSMLSCGRKEVISLSLSNKSMILLLGRHDRLDGLEENASANLSDTIFLWSGIWISRVQVCVLCLVQRTVVIQICNLLYQRHDTDLHGEFCRVLHRLYIQPLLWAHSPNTKLSRYRPRPFHCSIDKSALHSE